MGAVQGVQNPQLQALQGQLSGDLFYLQLIGDMSTGNSSRKEEDSVDVIMGGVDTNGKMDGKVSRWPLFLLSSIHPVADTLAERRHHLYILHHPRKHR